MKHIRHIVLFVLLLMVQWVSAATQLVSNDKNWLGAKAETTTTEGNDFWLTFMTNNATEADNPSLHMTIYAASDTAAHIIVEVNGNQLGVIDIPEGGGMGRLDNITPSAVYIQANESETRVNKGVHVYSQDKYTFFSCFALAEAGSGPGSTRDASLILPTRMLGKEYYVQTYPTDTRSTEFAVIATEDNTKITITPSAQTSKQTQEGQEITLTNMRKGEVYLIRSDEPNHAPKIDLSGSMICSNNPVAVFQGNEAAKIASGPTGAYSANHMYEQTLPIAQWGKEFYLGITAHAIWNFYNVTAAYDETEVYINNSATPITLNAGESFTAPKYMVNNPPALVNSDVKITANKPVMLNTYLSCGGANGEISLDGQGEIVTYSWGNSTMAMMPAWEMRVKKMSFFADSISNESEAGVRHMYVQIITKTADKNLFTLSLPDGTQQQIDGTLFNPITADGTMSVGNVELPNFSKYTIETTGEGFVGFVYNITSEARAYQYTLGYTPNPKNDSLFITNPEALMSHASYDMDSLDGHGWYQRQWDEWIEGKERLDTAVVCDSSFVYWTIESPFSKPIDSIEWCIYDVTGKVKPSPRNRLSGFPVALTPSATDTKHNLEHQFILPEEPEESRKPFFEYEVEMILLRNRVLCPDEEPDRDTLRNVVRVLRQYNDTTWRAICLGDTMHFFRDTVWLQHSIPLSGKPVEGEDFILQPSIFNDTTQDESRGLVQYFLGDTTITRTYVSKAGCDSLSTLRLFVCSPYFEHKDTVVCQDGTRGLDYGEFFKRFKQNNSWPKADTIIRDTLRAKGCMNTPEFDEFRTHCPKFNGCDSVLELHLNVKTVVRNTIQVNQCMSQGHIYEWREDKSDRLIRTFDANLLKKDTTYIFRDTVKYVNCEGCPEGGCDSVRNMLYLQFVSDDGQHHTIHVCQGERYTYTNMNTRYTFSSTGKLCNTPYIYPLNVEVRGIVDGRSVVMCEFIDSVTFYVDTVYKNQMTYDTVCIDPVMTSLHTQTYNWTNHPRFAEIPITRPGYFTYTDTLQTYDTGCDSICVLKLRVAQPQQKVTNTPICDDGAFMWEDTLFYGVNYKGDIPAVSKQITVPLYTSQKDTVTQYGCDSILKLILHIHPTYVAELKDTAVCANEPYNFYGTWYNTPTNRWVPGETYSLTIHDQSIHGCDSMVQHNVTVYPIYPDVREVNDTVCQEKGAYYTWPNHPTWTGRQSLAAAGSYELVDPLLSVNGCDSIIHRTLVVLPTYDLAFRHQMSSEDTVHWEGRIYAGREAEFDNPGHLEAITVTGVKTIVDSLTTQAVGSYSCDSVRTLTLRIGKVFRDTTYDATCANCGTYEWVINSPVTGEDTTIYIDNIPAPYEQRIYYDSLMTEMGYDSIYVRILTTYPNYEFVANDEICQGETYVWTGHMEGDNGIQHNLFVNGRPVTVIPTESHGIVFVTDSMVTDTVFTDPATGFVKPMHCDSVWTLTLTVHPTYNDRYVELTDYTSMSSNDTMSHFVHPHVLFVGYDFDYNAAGITQAELEQQYDVVTYLHPTGSETWRDSVVNISQFGCDSVHYVDLHICEMQFTQVTDSIADNDSTWFFGGDISNREHTLPLITGEKFHLYDDGTPVDYSQATGRQEREYFFIDTLRTANGCDSIVHNHLYVFPSYRFEYDTAICSNERYDWRKYTYLNHNKSAPVYDSVNYQVGTHTFDSVYVLNLEVVPSGYWQYDTVLCMNDTILWHYQRIYYQPGGLQYIEAVYKDAHSKCGDIYHLNLQFMPFYSTTLIEYDTVCQDMPYHWITDGEVNEHTENLRNGSGVRLSSIPTDVPGDYVYYDSLKTVSCGCDSVYTLKLHVNPTYHIYDTTYVMCSSDTLEWHDRSYTYQGQLEVFDTIFSTASNHCDSIHYMKLHFDLSYDSTTTVFLCSDVEHYQWEDIIFDDTLRAAQSWLEPRNYQFSRTYPTVLAGCDSTLRLDITIAPNFDSIWTDTICRGETYNLFGQLLTEPGEYRAQQPNKWGCTTFYYLTLVVLPPTTFDIQVDPVCVEEDGLANVYLLHYTYHGAYEPVAFTVRYDSAAHEIGFEDAYDVPISSGETTLQLPVPVFMNKEDYPRPGRYQASIAFTNGVCLSDSLMTYDFQMEMNYPSWLTEQRYSDVIALLNADYNGGYTWSEYQWYQGDSMLVGQTKPYLHIPTGLTVGEQYYVVLTREGETEGVPTCPITVVSNPNGNDYTPTMGYLSVTPTCIVRGNPVTYILSRKGGTYRINSSEGRLVSEGSFNADVTPVQLPAVEGMYIIQLWSPATPEEPYRAIKVLVREICESCATSF